MPNDPHAVQFGWHTAPWRSFPGGAQTGVVRTSSGLFTVYHDPNGFSEAVSRLPIRI